MTEPKKANHQANIVTVREVLPHNNADSLEIVPVQEYQIVARKGQFKVGDLGVYIQPDSVVPQTEPFRFIWQPYLDDRANNPDLCKHGDETGPFTAKADGHEVCLRCHLNEPFVVPEKKRRITVRKFRGEWSEGLLLPLSDFNWEHPNTELLTEGQDVSDILGITHYDPDEKPILKGETSAAPKLRKKYPQSLKGWASYLWRRIKNVFNTKPDGGVQENVGLGIPTYDVDSLKNYPHVFVEGEEVIVTEKIHGSNARYIFLDGIMYAGSRNLWKSPTSTCIFRKNLKENPWIEEWCRAHEGYVLWGELTPTQGGYDYGSKKPQFFVFDVRHPDGHWIGCDKQDEHNILIELRDHFVPPLYSGPFNLEKIKTLVDGPSTVPGATTIREGVVIKTIPERHVRGVGRAQLKIVSNKFLEKDNK